MRPPYLLSTLDPVKDITLHEMVKDTALRELLLKTKEELYKSNSNQSSTVTYKNYVFNLSPIYTHSTKEEPGGYFLVIPNIINNSMISLYEGANKDKVGGGQGPRMSLMVEKDDDLTGFTDKIVSLCREQYGLSPENMRNILSGFDHFEKVN
jgi:hypothetical protein